MDRHPTVSVVVCAHDLRRLELLERAVEGVRLQDPPPHEIVLVVDHNDELLAAARERFPDVLILPNAESSGLSGARNTGVRASSGDVVAFLDDDAAPREGWIAGLLSAYRDPDVLGAGGWIVPAWQLGMPAWFPHEFLWVVGCSYRGLPTHGEPVRNMIGANMSFRRSVFERVGGFNEGVGRGRGLPLGCEETELCIRAARAVPGGRFVLVPGAVVDHFVPRQRGRIQYFLVRSYAEGISKAYVVRLVGASSGMASERRYASRTLPSGVVRHLGSVRPWALGGLARAAMIVAGLGAFGVGYLRGRLRFRGAPAAGSGQPLLRPEE